MLSSARPSVPPRPRYLDGHRRNNVVEPKSTSQGHRREEKSTKITSNSANSSSVSRGSKVSAEHHKPRGSHLGRSTAGQTRVAQGKNIPATSKLKPKVAHIAPGPSSVLDPNCNEPSLPCLCCDGHSPHDSNSLYNHNYNNNNTTAIRQHLHLQPAQPHTGVGAHQKAGDTQQNPRSAVSPSHNGLDTQQRGKSEQNEEQEINELDEGEDFDNNDDDEDEDTLVPSCHDCPPSLLEFSLSSSTSSSSTSISSCSDFESDCPDINTSSFLEMSSEKNLLNGSPTSQPQIIPMGANHTVPQPLPPYSPDEGYPSARSSPSSDYIEHKASLGQETSKVNLLTYLNSSSELSKMDYWSKVVEVAQWGMEGDIALQDRLSHLEKLTLVNKQVKITYLERIRDSGLDLDEEDLSDSLDGTGNMEVTWRLYRGDSICESQEFSDAGVDLSAPSDLDEPLQPDSLAPSPLQPPPRPPKPTLRNSESHTYVNINNNIPASTASSAMTSFQTVSPSLSSSMPEKTIPAPPPLPLAPSQPIPYFTFYSSPPTLASPPPPIPPPRRRHKARLEAQKFANLQDESTPLSLPPPTSRPPPLPPPPAAPSPPAIPPPPTLPPPPSFHALDAEIRKLLVLAGLTQAELLKLSPELGVCVTGVLEEGDGELSEVVRPQIREVSTEEMGQKHDRKQVPEEECGEGKKDEGGEMKGVRRESTVGEHEQDVLREGAVQEESREAFQTTSFTEMARRRRRNNVISNCSCTYGLDNHSNPDAYYSTTSTSVIASNHDISSHNTYDYTITMASSPPPPPPPRPLPPCPPKLPQPPPLPSLSLSTLSANKARPDRSDWLIAFSPDTETPPFGADRTPEVSPQKAKVGSKVTTFKELRFRSRQNPQPLVVQPEPDPTVITPDPDVLYNLKWRKEKADGDGSQWEYLPQVQSIFLQHQLPPPLPEKREVLPVSDAGGQSQSCPSQRIGCSASDSDLWSSGATGQDESWRKKEEDEGAVRGRADGGRKWESGTTVRSLSFAGSAQRGSSWMEDASKNPLRGQKLSSLCLEEKRALVSAVSVAVEAVLAQFSSSRTLVQKAQSGDSTINPALGRLVLQCLCPALRALLSDGLKPHQSDLITGRRPNSPWGLVQASTQPGPNTQALYALQGRIAELPQLRHARHRFNAFLLGLLNVKLLDYWLAHLQTCEDVLATYYLPTSFMRLSHSLCQPLFEELLLLLQPLSLLTFNLDLLFQHHHLDPSSPTPSPSPRSPDVGSTFHVSPKALVFGNRARLESVSEHDYGELEEAADSWGASSGTSEGKRAGGSREEEQACQSPTPRVKVGATSQLLWVQEKELLPPGQASLSKQATQVIQQGWGAVLRWGERLGQNWGSFNTSSQVTSGGTDPQALAQNVWLGESPGSVTQPDIISHQTHGDHPFDRTPAVPWGLGRLFGASRDPRSAQTHTSSTSVSPVLPALSRRRPSHWLAPGVSTLSRMVSPTLNPVPEDRGDVSEGTKETDGEEGNPRAYRSVRTLCDHSGTGAELSFQKGEELVVLGTVDHDWVRCRRGDMEGLVPIGYTSLIM
ncbi:uncharacterized protein rusc1 isoform X3 [Paramormyrops kingsleyae]|uniref:uncharacterized protein rusc1 isoform X3 n=1 Tax=Paramormyrops kingsleyae TaxID=1676925 RepID=UPI003B978274